MRRVNFSQRFSLKKSESMEEGRGFRTFWVWGGGMVWRGDVDEVVEDGLNFDHRRGAGKDTE